MAMIAKSPSLRPLILPIALALFVNLVAVLFAQNRVVMAFWYVWTELLLPIALGVLVWTCGLLLFHREPISAAKLIMRQLIVLVLLFFALPCPLSCLNFWPAGQTTSTWYGNVTSDELITVGRLHARKVWVSSKTLGPFLRFHLDDDDVTDFVGTSPSTPVRGTVVRGFMGVPIAARVVPLTKP
jgi:hypothetical protein